jgi:hypothetical protein
MVEEETVSRRDRIGAEIVRISEEHGDTLTPGAVVEAARPKDSPLHGEFEWDNKKGGEKYREMQARRLIQVYVIRAGPRTERGFVSVMMGPKSSDREYQPVHLVRDDPTAVLDVMNGLRAYGKRALSHPSIVEVGREVLALVAKWEANGSMTESTPEVLPLAATA